MCKIMTLTRTMPQLSTLLQAANMTLLNTTTASSAKVCCGACRMTELQVSSFSEGHALCNATREGSCKRYPVTKLWCVMPLALQL